MTLRRRHDVTNRERDPVRIAGKGVTMSLSPGQMVLPFPDWDPERFVSHPTYRPPGPESRYVAVVAYLRRHPGEWRCIDRRPNPSSAVMLAKNVRRGKPRVFAGLDATVRRGFEVWACCPADYEGPRGATQP